MFQTRRSTEHSTGQTIFSRTIPTDRDNNIIIIFGLGLSLGLGLGFGLVPDLFIHHCLVVSHNLQRRRLDCYKSSMSDIFERS